MQHDLKDNIEQFFYTLSVICILFGGILWLANMNSICVANMGDIRDIKDSKKIEIGQFEEIRTRLTRIEDSLSKRK